MFWIQSNNYSTVPGNLSHLDYTGCREALRRRLSEPAPGRIQLVTGPRQVGKTTVLLELAAELGERATYIAADGSEAALPGFWERLWNRAEEMAASQGRTNVVLIDEVQHLAGWAARLKAEWDRLRRRHLPVHVVATGSSALRLASGSKESLAGRYERLTLAHWSASALARTFNLAPDDAAELVVRMGAYPGAMELRNDMPRWAAYVRDAIVEPAISRDILALAAVRRPALLRQVFAVAAASPAQIVSLQKLQGQLQDRGALETLAHYLHLLEEAYVMAPLEKHASRPARRRAAPPKLVTLSNALLAVVDPRGIPDAAREPERFGAWVENACLAFAWNSGYRVAYWREEPMEVDGVIDGSRGSWAIEVKTGPFGVAEVRGLLEFTRRFPRYQPLLLCDPSELPAAARVGVPAISWKRFLLDGPKAP
ncbi:MAG: ATP-binding protein [Deltaproteobacteria bacterium]|nr:MAG: ATP-binding protein [Deltaproteobacteria bacterium]